MCGYHLAEEERAADFLCWTWFIHVYDMCVAIIWLRKKGQLIPFVVGPGFTTCLICVAIIWLGKREQLISFFGPPLSTCLCVCGYHLAEEKRAADFVCWTWFTACLMCVWLSFD